MPKTKGKVDLRTKAGQRQLIIDEVMSNGGFTIWWITANQVRACMSETMKKSGELVTTTGRTYPWMDARINKNKRRNVR